MPTTKKEKIMTVADDLGYGEVKANIDGEYIKQPSVVAEVKQITNDKIDHTNKNAVDQGINDLMNNLDINFNNHRYLVGNLASSSTLTRETFDINSREGKAKTNLAMILPLSFIAAKAVQEAYSQNKDIFTPLTAKVAMVTALPINEIGVGNNSTREEYANRFLKGKHIITFNNFDSVISVTIDFKAVKVYKEGEIATGAAIKHGPKELQNSLIKSIKKDYPDRADNAQDLIISANNILGIDIGQGTTDLALTSDGRADVYNSTSIPVGYGTLLRQAMKILSKMPNGFPVTDILELSRILNNTPTNVIDKKRQQIAMQALDDTLNSLTDKIISNLSDILSINNNLQIVYVFGGGSIPLKSLSNLEQEIKDDIANHTSPAVLVWVDPKYAQNLNEIGLKIIADFLVQQVK